MSSLTSVIQTGDAKRKEAHYNRHKEQILKKRKALYNIKKRYGRRKVGKASRAELEDMIFKQITHQLPEYSNSIVHRHQTPDSEQDAEMYTKEHEFWSQCALKKLELQRSTQMGGEYWVEPYLVYVEGLRQLALNQAMQALRKPNCGSWETHFHRRLIAFYHQEEELLRQGENIWDAAQAEEALVMYGRRVHRPKFKSLYGF